MAAMSGLFQFMAQCGDHTRHDRDALLFGEDHRGSSRAQLRFVFVVDVARDADNLFDAAGRGPGATPRLDPAVSAGLTTKAVAHRLLLTRVSRMSFCDGREVVRMKKVVCIRAGEFGCGPTEESFARRRGVDVVTVWFVHRDEIAAVVVQQHAQPFADVARA